VVTTATVFDWMYNALRWTWHDPDGYAFLSGPLADITLLGGGYALLRHHNCHAKGCWRIGRYRVDGTGYVVCRRHHPHPRPTAAQIRSEHAAHQRRLHEADAAAAAAAHDVTQVAHEVAGDVHDVAQVVKQELEREPEPRPPSRSE
jgi:hypothetical protein